MLGKLNGLEGGLQITSMQEKINTQERVKKGGKSILPVVRKLYAVVLKNRGVESTGTDLRVEKCGFRKETSPKNFFLW